MLATFLMVLVTAATYVQADVNPNNPGPGDILIEGQSVQIGWDIDPTGLWKNMSIELMTGDNFNMVHLTTIAVVDGTDPTNHVFSYTCPKVTPHSPIYFFQFSASDSLKTWTGRFTITDMPTDVVPPTEPVQPDGTMFPWGTGRLVDTAPSALNPATATGAAPGMPTDANTMHGSPLDGSVSTATSASPNNATVSPAPTPKNAKDSNAAVDMAPASSRLRMATLTLCLSAFVFALMF
ncbi:hypothetical protein F5I97DRAFT_108710 [Phlebopus sp. FC_14]|nr:hypothetical protein F5I97DRAFT_108710 [Phlebopus sp. FC_14]